MIPKLTAVQRAFLSRLVRRPMLIRDADRACARKMAERGLITILASVPRSRDRSRETHWHEAALTDAGRAILDPQRKTPHATQS